MHRIGVVGASSLAGKELAEVLVDSVLAASDVVLLDGEEMAGQVTAVGDEASVVQQLDAESFVGMDIAFFTGDTATTRSHWLAARQAGASIVDLSGALAGEAEVLVLAPWVEEALGGPDAARAVPNLGTSAVVAAHPAAVMLGLVAARLSRRFAVTHLAATVLEPASEHGRLAMDELHEQTVKLLSFQPLPKTEYDAQVAFNLLPSSGADAKVRTAAVRQRIVEHYGLLSAGRLPALAVQLVLAPVFHGYTASVLVELAEPVEVEKVMAALMGAHLSVVMDGDDPPSNLSAAGQEDLLVRVTAASGEETGTRFWLWMAADNLRLAALHGIACAVELMRLRPRGTVQ